MELLNGLVVWRELKPNTAWALCGVITLLVAGSLAVRVLRVLRPQKDFTELRLRVRTWWVMAGLFVLALALKDTYAICFFGFISFLALKEFLSLIPTRRADRRVLFWAYLAIPFQYYWVSIGWYGMFIAFIPVFVFIALPVRMVMIGETSGFIRAVGTLHWGLMTTVFTLSHIAYLLVLPMAGNPVAGGAGLVLYLVGLTQLNDVAQYCWGKSFGKHKVIPLVSPNKTWEGLIGGIATTTALAVALAPVLTPLTRREALLAGLIIGPGGFLGDATIASFKRDLGIKDSGSILPGHGGILDRVNSLTFTAPLFFHYIWYTHF